MIKILSFSVFIFNVLQVQAKHPNGSVGTGLETFRNSSILNLKAPTVTQETTCQRRRCKRPGLDPWVRKIPWRRTQ